MNITIKAIISGGMLYISYFNNLFSPLIWALLLLVVLDILLNAHKEGQQLTKIGSAFATLGGTGLLENGHVFSTDVIHGLVAVMFLAYVQVVVPQIINVFKKLKFLAPTTKTMALMAAEAEIAKLKDQALKDAQKAEQENKVIVTEKITP